MKSRYNYSQMTLGVTIVGDAQSQLQLQDADDDHDDGIDCYLADVLFRPTGEISCATETGHVYRF